MTQLTQRIDRNLEVQPQTGALAVAHTSPVLEIEGWVAAVINFHITDLIMADADDEVDFYIQMRYDNVWTDVANLHFDNADEAISVVERLIKIGPLAAGIAVFAPTDATLADDTVVALPVGDALRVKVALSGATAPSFDFSVTATGFSIAA